MANFVAITKAGVVVGMATSGLVALFISSDCVTLKNVIGALVNSHPRGEAQPSCLFFFWSP